MELRGFTTVVVQREKKRITENKKKNAKPFCTLVVARLSSSYKKGLAGGSKRGSTGGPTLKFYCGLKHRKNSILESRIFIVVAFCQEVQ